MDIKDLLRPDAYSLGKCALDAANNCAGQAINKKLVEDSGLAQALSGVNQQGAAVAASALSPQAREASV